MRHKLIGLLEQSPVIPAVKDEAALTRAAGCDSRVLFLLGGDLLTIPGWIARTHEAGKQAVVHIDLVNGLAPKEVAVDWLLHQGVGRLWEARYDRNVDAHEDEIGISYKLHNYMTLEYVYNSEDGSWLRLIANL